MTTNYSPQALNFVNELLDVVSNMEVYEFDNNKLVKVSNANMVNLTECSYMMQGVRSGIIRDFDEFEDIFNYLKSTRNISEV